MAQSEDILWEILNIMYEHKSGWTSEGQGKVHKTEIDNAHTIKDLKGKLVLKFIPQDIEDTIYFMKHRNYIGIHGHGTFEFVYSLTDKAIEVYKKQLLPEDEREAFKSSLWTIEPKIYGMGPNIKGWKKEWKKIINLSAFK